MQQEFIKWIARGVCVYGVAYIVYDQYNTPYSFQKNLVTQ